MWFKSVKYYALFTLSICGHFYSSAQYSLQIVSKPVSLQQAIDSALKNNHSVKAASYLVARQKVLGQGAVNIDKANITFSQGQLNSVYYDNNFTISQRFEYPTVYKNQLKLADAQTAGSLSRLEISRLDLVNNVKSTYYKLIYFINKRGLFAVARYFVR